MHLDRRLAGWGVFLVLLGAVPLLVRQGVLTTEMTSRAWTLWPLLLVAAGMGLLLRATRFEILGGLLTAATLGVLGGAVLAGGLAGGCSDDAAANAAPAQVGEFGSSAIVELVQTCGDLTVTTAAGTSWRVEGLRRDSPPKIESAPDRLRVTSADRAGFDFAGTSDDWTVTLPTASPIDLGAEVNAGSGRFDLAHANLGPVRVTVNAGTVILDLAQVASIGGLDVHLNAVGDARILLPNLPLSGSIDANAAGNIRLCPPSGAGLRLTTTDNIAATNNYADRGLVQVGDAWQSAGYAAAAVKIQLVTHVNAGGFNLEPAGTCGG
jgi:hypothetical protein